MATLPNQNTTDLWGNLQWRPGTLTKTTSKNQPLEVKEAPTRTGLYRMYWTDEDSWKTVRKSFSVKSTLKVEDRELEFKNLSPPVLLTIGKTTNLYERVRQHFGTNPNNNRIIRRLGHLLVPKPVYDDLIELVTRSLQFDWVEVASWVDRCLLEKYGCSIDRPILDLQAEH